MINKEPLLVVENLKQHFKVNRKFTVKAVDGISFKIYPGETYDLLENLVRENLQQDVA